jgi:hypothetical protein
MKKRQTTTTLWRDQFILRQSHVGLFQGERDRRRMPWRFSWLPIFANLQVRLFNGHYKGVNEFMEAADQEYVFL